MDPRVDPSLLVSQTASTSPTARADAAVCDYSRHVAGELGVVDPNLERGDLDLMGHRVTELTVDEWAA